MEIVDNVNPKKSEKGLIVALTVLGVVIVGLIVGIVIAFSTKKEIETSDDNEDLSGIVADYLMNKDSGVDIEGTKKKLKKIIDESNSVNKKTRAASDLVALYDTEEEKAAIMNELLDNSNLNDEERYRFLSILLTIYKDYEDNEKCKETLIRLLDLPEDMALEAEDWSMIRTMFKNELEALENNYEN